MDVFYKQFGLNLKSLREQNDLSRYRVAKDLNIPSSTLLNWERGDSTIRLDMAAKIAGYYGLSIDDLLYNCTLEKVV